MWLLLERRRVRRLTALLFLAASAVPCRGDANTSTTSHATRPSSSTPSAEPTCESRTVNYITHTLPQQCLTSSPSPSSAPSTPSATEPTSVAITSTSSVESPPQASSYGNVADDSDLDADGNDLSTGAFMSFEEWKAMMLEKSGQEALEARPRKPKDGRGDGYPGEEFDSLGDEGEISLDFDAYSDKISEITSATKPSRQDKEREAQVEKVKYDEGLTQGYRSKDAGKTCKERASYSSFDAGATVLKASPGAKNPTAILVENKDSYMLLECAMKNKFFIVELSDDILVDTVVLANYEFFSSMIRHFRVSVSDRYPVKLEKWKDLGTYEARNSRNIQPFLVENPQIWARYVRVEILSHFGNEYYCPVSLLRVHGTRMLDSWKEADPSDLEGEDESSKPSSEAEEETIVVVDTPPEETEVVEPVQVENRTVMVEQSDLIPYWSGSYFKLQYVEESICVDTDLPESPSQTDEENGRNTASARPEPARTAGQTGSIQTSQPSTEATMAQSAEQAAESSTVTSTATASQDFSASPAVNTVEVTASSASNPTEASSEAGSSTVTPSVSVKSSSVQNVPKHKTVASTSVKPPSSRTAVKPPSGTPTTTPRNKTTTTTSSAAASPTVQDSFFKALTKRLQNLESNTTLSLQYIESQSKFLQEALARLERRQVAKVDLFLDTLNKTVLGELRESRAQYDQIWQSTVIALETQREQSEREIVALSSRLGVLADEVVFQKRMAIVQSVLLLGCLVLVIFSRGLASSAAVTGLESYYPSQFLGSSSRIASPVFPSTPKALSRSGHPHHSNHHHHNNAGLLSADEPGSTTSTPAQNNRNHNHNHNLGSSPQSVLSRSPSQTPDRPHRQPRRASISHDSEAPEASPSSPNTTGRRPPSPSRVLSDPSGLAMDYFQPPTPSSMNNMVDIGYDSEPALTPGGDYFSAATSVNGDGGGGESSSTSTYPDLLARKSERQLTPSSDVDSGAEYVVPRTGLTRNGSARKPLPALPEDPD